MIFGLQKTNSHMILNLFGLKLNFRTKKKTKFINNYFNTKYDKTVLILYLLDWFVGDKHVGHSNVAEAYFSAEIFSDLGYNIDVIDHEYARSKPRGFFAGYDVVYGKTPSQAVLCGTNVITYSGGVPFKNLNKEALKTGYDFYKASGQNPLNSLCEGTYSYLIFNKNIFLGNNHTKEQFVMDGLEEVQKLYNLNGFYFDIYDIEIQNKDFSSARKHFLWWGSRGALHKGLNIVIDIFKNRPDLTLHICGFKENEHEFFNYYNEALTNQLPNIINHGFVDMQSDDFKQIMNTCCAVVSPSLSEGGAIGIINVMANGGMIPIISTTSGLDVEHYGFMFDKIDVRTVSNFIDKFVKLSTDEIKELSIKVKNETRDTYSIDNYKSNLKAIFNEILKV